MLKAGKIHAQYHFESKNTMQTKRTRNGGRVERDAHTAELEYRLWNARLSISSESTTAGNSSQAEQSRRKRDPSAGKEHWPEHRLKSFPSLALVKAV